MNVEVYSKDTHFTQNQIEGIHKIFLNALEYNLHSVIYNIIIEWNWFELLCTKLSTDELTYIALIAKTCEEFKYYTDFNNPKTFNVYNNVRDILEISKRYDVLDKITTNVHTN
jgi:hypothetical protein